MSTAYYVRYWSNKEDYIAWTPYETEYFSSKQKAQKFINNDCLNDNPVFAYELGFCYQDGDDYENHEPYEFFNSDKIYKEVEIIVAYKDVSEFIKVSLECSLNDINTKNHLNIAIEKLKDNGVIEEDDKAFAFEKESIENFLAKKTKPTKVKCCKI